jgi:hypothetical protein
MGKKGVVQSILGYCKLTPTSSQVGARACLRIELIGTCARPFMAYKLRVRKHWASLARCNIHRQTMLPC